MKFLKDYWGLMLAIGCFIAYIFYSKSKTGNGFEIAQADEKPSGIPDPTPRPKPDPIFTEDPLPVSIITPKPPIETESKPRVEIKPVQDQARPPGANSTVGISIEPITEVQDRTPVRFAVSRSIYAL